MGVGLIGCGAIGTVLAHAMDEGRAGDARLVAVYDLMLEKSRELVNGLTSKPKIAETLEKLLEYRDIDLIVEAASQGAVRQYASRVLRAGKNLMIMSVGALVDYDLTEEIRNEARAFGKRVYLPSGAIAGLDGVKAAAIGRIDKVILTTRKPPAGLKDVPYVRRSGIDIDALKEPTVVYEGRASEACKLFPLNVNVAAALSLAGIGQENTEIRVIADPTMERNVHEVSVKGEFGELKTRTENVPSAENPKTSYLAALSAVATLKKITEHMLIGT